MITEYNRPAHAMEPLRIVYPTEDRKYYVGCVCQHAPGRWRVRIRSPYPLCDKMFDTEAEARQFHRSYCIKMGYVKNIIYVYENHAEMALHNNELTKIDIADIERVQALIWHKHNGVTDDCVQSSNPRTILHHHLLEFTAHSGLSVDHINRNPMDNRRVNLRIANNKTQCINRNQNSRNTSGYAGVTYNSGSKCWVAAWEHEGKRCSRAFSVAKYGDNAKVLAIAHRKHIETTHPDYILALQVPLA